MKLLPFPRPGGDKTLLIEGVEVALLRKGKGTSGAKVGAPVPATLEFYAQPLPEIRGTAQSPEKFATLEGTLELRGASRKPVFINGPDAEALPNRIQYVEALKPEVRPENRLRPRRISIQLKFDDGSFEGMLDTQQSNSHLVLPELPEGCLFVEVDTKILVNGAVEAEVEVSDRLDAVLFGPVGPLVPPTSVGFQLQDAAGRPPKVPIQFTISDPEATEHQGQTNAQGQGFVDGVTPGLSHLTLKDLAPADWGAEVKAGAAATDRTVGELEDVPAIALKEGFRSPLSIYDFEENADFRTTRPNLNQLAQDDQLKLPPKEAEPFPLQSGQLKQLTLASRPVERLTLRIKTDEQFRYELVIGSQRFVGDNQGGNTIDQEVPVGATQGTLQLMIGERAPFRQLNWDLQLAALEPAATDRGVQARLANLGFDPGGVDGNFGKNSKAALARFQRLNGFEPTGELDDASRAELEKQHDQA